MKQKQLIGAKRQRSVRPAFVVTELYLVYTGCKPLDNRADMALGVFRKQSSPLL